ncbi:MAG: DUF499 domain-containing protein [Thermoflexales bacterium]|nr:DUF499 domain-containing protein [Thermoflexales bacterium]
MLKPWYAFATPHADIRSGRLAEAVFAANLWAVVRGEAPQVYLDPDEFFRKTYLTVGLTTVLRQAAAGLRGDADAGNRIIGLQTAFGGGKTHALVALWHLARHADHLRTSPSAAALRDALGDRLPPRTVRVAVFTNQTCDVTQGRTVEDGLRLHTLWGELAYQLGGRALYERVRPNDEARRVPQGLFAEVLRAAAPCLILLDELADYCIGAAAVSVGETTLADQTISFVQQLTEAAQQVPNVVLVATLPASRLEVAQSEKGQEAFTTLEKRFRRLGADIKPVADEEIYEVVRARLFESVAPPTAPDAPAQVARAYYDLYVQHGSEVPSEATRPGYRALIERAYPFHPLTIDAFYTRWGSHPDFQRTRGALRLLASIVADLWQHRAASTMTQHLIQPCHLNWSIDALQGELTRLWGTAFQSVAAADVIGEHSNAGAMDEERGGDYARESIIKGVAAAILLGSFGGQAERIGFSTKDLKLACAREGLWNYLDSALLSLEERCFYLSTAPAGNLGKRYWFSTKPTLNKLIVQYRQQAERDSFNQAISESLRAALRTAGTGGATWRVLPEPDENLAEQRALTLLILPPSLAWDEGDGASQIREWVRRVSLNCGSRERVYRNTLVFLAASARGLSQLRRAHRDLAALEGVQRDYGAQLDNEQRQELAQRLEAKRREAEELLSAAYTIALRVRNQADVEHCTLNEARQPFAKHLQAAWDRLVEEEEWIVRTLGPITLQENGIPPAQGGLALKDVVEAFLRFTDKPMIATREAVTIGLSRACEEGFAGIGRGTSLGALHARYCKQRVKLDPHEDGVWVIPPFEPAPPEPKPDAGTTSALTAPQPNLDPAPQPSPTPSHFGRSVRRLRIEGAVPVEQWTELFSCFVRPAAQMDLQQLSLGVRFDFAWREGTLPDENDPAIQRFKEAARQLGLRVELE